MSILAIDCDLRKLYAVDDAGNVVANGVQDIRMIPLMCYTTVLFEIASAIDYTDNKGIAHQKRRWTIFNIYQATVLDHLLPGRARFAPSSAWTKGYPLAVRHKLANVAGMNKDLRECVAMIRFHARDPNVWAPLTTIMEKL